MNILAVDTSGPVAGVAVLRDGEVAYEGAAVNRLTHSVNTLPMVEEALDRAGLDVSQIDLYAAVTGPGSFTGVRIGVSTLKGMAHGAGKLCVAVDALEALAFGCAPSSALLCPIQDARAGQVYGAAFKNVGEPLLCRRMADTAIKLDEYLQLISQMGDTLLFMGDGVAPHRAEIERTLGKRARFAPAQHVFLRPAAVALLAQSRCSEAVDYLALQPLYLRAPQAERLRMAREGANA